MRKKNRSKTKSKKRESAGKGEDSSRKRERMLMQKNTSPNFGGPHFFCKREPKHPGKKRNGGIFTREEAS